MPVNGFLSKTWKDSTGGVEEEEEAELFADVIDVIAVDQEDWPEDKEESEPVENVEEDLYAEEEVEEFSVDAVVEED